MKDRGLVYLLQETVEEAKRVPIIHKLIETWRHRGDGRVAFGDWAAAQGCAALDPLIKQRWRDFHVPFSGSRGSFYH